VGPIFKNQLTKVGSIRTPPGHHLNCLLRRNWMKVLNLTKLLSNTKTPFKMPIKIQASARLPMKLNKRKHLSH
jgi:hypothetical protein